MSITPYLKAGKKTYRAKIKFQNRQYTKAGFKTQANAKAWMVEEKRRLKKTAGQVPTPETTKLTYSAASASYLADSKARHQPGTFAEKSRHLTEFIESIGYDLPVENITAEQAHVFISSIQQNATNKTANRYLRTLKAFWTWTSRRHSIGSNPFILVEPYPEDTAPRYIPPLKDVLAVLSVAEEWERDFLTILVKTAARPEEVRALTWSDVDFTRNTITLWTRKRKGGARQPRVINMSGQLTETLKIRLTLRESETWVFVNPETKKPFTRQSRPYKFLMERLCERAAEKEQREIPAFTYYAFRHFVATQLRNSGKASRYEIQHILGHLRSDTTDIYLRSLVPDVAEAVNALDDAVDLDLLNGKKSARVIHFKK